jgi:rhamnosyltransferase
MSPEASIVLLTKNAGPQFRSVLDSLFEQSGDFEVLVIDSGSTDTTIDIAREYPLQIFEIDPAEFDHGGTRNFGASKASGQYVCFLTQDAIPEESWLQTLLQPLRRDETIAGAYSRQLPRSNATPMKRHFLQEFYPETPETREHSEGVVVPLEDTFFSNVASAIRRDILEEIPFPEQAIMSEDQLWAKRALESGYKIRYEAASMVRHSHREGTVDIFKRYFDSGASLTHLTEEGTETNITSSGLGYVGRELRYLVKNGAVKWVPYALVYNGAKFAGYQIGKHGSLLPKQVRVRLSDSLSRKHA